jgi:hypothetical protein
MKFKIADWRIEVTWDGLFMQPLERAGAKKPQAPAVKSSRRAAAAAGQSFGLAVQTFNKQRHQKGATK